MHRGRTSTHPGYIGVGFGPEFYALIATLSRCARIERAVGAAARPLRNCRRVDGAHEVRQALEGRARRALRRYTSFRNGRVELMRLAPSQAHRRGAEGQFARARRDVDVTRATDDGVGLNRDLPAGRKVDIG